MATYYPVIVLFASIIIIILAFFTTRLISGGFNHSISNRNLRFVEKLPLGVDKSLILIQLENHYYLMYISKNGAQLIDKLDSIKLKDTMTKNVAFNEILKNLKGNVSEDIKKKLKK